MQELVGKLTAQQLWALIVLVEGKSALRHRLKDDQGGSPAFRVDVTDRS
jgi:hypothetical protein